MPSTPPAERPARFTHPSGRRPAVSEAWAAARALGGQLWREATNRDDPGWPPRWLRYGGVALGGVTVAVLLAEAIVPGVVWLLRTMGGWAGRGARWTHLDGVAALVPHAVKTYVTGHAAGLGVPGSVLMWVWMVAGVVLFVASAARTAGGRVGWLLFGAISVLFAAEGSPPAARSLVAGVAGLWWSVLSLAAYNGLGRPRQVLLPVQPPSEAGTRPPAAQGREPEPQAPAGGMVRDAAALAAQQYAVVLRRAQLRAPRGPAAGDWAVTGLGGGAFTAVDDRGAHVVGVAMMTEAVPELIAAAAAVTGGVTTRWTGPPIPAPRRPRLDSDNFPGLRGLADFVDAGNGELRQVARALQELRARWNPAEVDELIQARAEVLNRESPLIRPAQFLPRSDPAAELGWVATHTWIDPATVVSGPARSWNDFADHRPDVVGLIVGTLLTAVDVRAAYRSVLTDMGIAHLQRIPGPAGPLHEITSNGTHRVHALRILGVPLLAGEVTVTAAPAWLREHDMWSSDFRGPVVPLWRGLIDKALIQAELATTGDGVVLELLDVPAPWLLRPPQDVVAIAAAYERVYPGALAEWGVPAAAVVDAEAWLGWVTSG